MDVESNMQKKVTIILFALIFLVSCASPALPPTARSEPEKTATPAPTKANTPTPTQKATETSTLSPTPAPIRPFLTKEDTAHFDMNTWGVPISYDQFVELYNQSSDYIQYDDTTEPMYIASILGENSAILNGVPGVNMFLEHAALVEPVPGEQPFHVLMWKMVVKGPDGHNILIPWNTVHEPPNGDFQRFISDIQFFGRAQNVLYVNLKILTRNDQYLDHPLKKALINENELRSTLQGGIIDPNIGDAWLWCIEISTTAPGQQ
jgi:hypothetical protein